jgi:diguanylate cyclase (GGDEF)-like protein
MNDDLTTSVNETKLRLLKVWSWWFWVIAVATLVAVALDVGWRDRLLLAGVLLFAVVAFYQQLSADRMRRQVAGQLIADLSRRTEFLEELTMIDPLTGLFNRRFLTKRLPYEFARAERQDCPITLMMIDLNDFKEINDSFGHAAGDAALQEFASALRSAVRYADLPVRFGGDEFVVVLPDCDLDQASLPLHRLQHCKIAIEGIQVPLPFSMGCAQRQPAELPESLLQRADAALYEAKRMGSKEKH